MSADMYQALETLKSHIESVTDYINPRDLVVDYCAADAELLHQWASDDIDELCAVGLNRALFDSIPTRADALRAAETDWLKIKHKTKDAIKAYKEKSPLGVRSE